MATDVRLSVDLGTTWTAAAVLAGGEPEPLPLGTDGPAMPSVVAAVEGSMVAGAAAVRAAATDPASSAREFKRRLGDTAPIVLGGTPYGAETLTGHLLAHVLRVAAERVGEPTAVTLTHPAVFGAYKLDLMREAARVAGLGDVTLLSEPEAAALHYARLGRLGPGDVVAVYDFGGGTFDAAVVRLDPSGPVLLGRPEGLERLGGIDLDHAVLAHVDAALDGVLSQLDPTDPDVRRGVLALREECVAAKEALSADTEVSVPVTLPGLATEVRVTRVEFESFVRPRIGETLDALDRAIASTGLTAGDLAGVVLVGGSSRIPLVVEQVGAHTGRPLLVDADPKLVVVLGAAPGTARPATEEAAMSPTQPTGEPTETPAATDAAAEGKNPDAKATEGKPAAGKPGDGKAGASGASSERRTAPGHRTPERAGMSTAGKVATGVAAAAAATAAGVFWREDLAEAVGLGDDDGADDGGVPIVGPDPAVEAAAAAEAAVVPPPAADESLDAFDAIADTPGTARGFAPGGGNAGGGVGGGGGGGRGAAPTARAPRPEPAAARADAPPRPTTGTAAATATGAVAGGQQPPVMTPPDDGAAPVGASGTGYGDGSGTMAASDPAFEAARAELQQRLEEWEPPQGADPDEVAELRERLEGLLDRYEPRPGQSLEDAIAELREQFELRVENFTQDQRIAALIDEVRNITDSLAPDPDFEVQRAALRDALADWEAPEGTSPEDAATLRAELQALVDRFQPAPGQTAEQSLAALRATFADHVQDFVQDLKIDALVDAELARDGADATTEETGTEGTANDETEMPTRPDVTSTVIIDDFDAMIDLPDVTATGTDSTDTGMGTMGETAETSGTFAMGEPTPGQPVMETAGMPVDDVLGVDDLGVLTVPAPDAMYTPQDLGTAIEDLSDRAVAPPHLLDEQSTAPDAGMDDGMDDTMGDAIPQLDERLTTSIDDLVATPEPDAVDTMGNGAHDDADDAMPSHDDDLAMGDGMPG